MHLQHAVPDLESVGVQAAEHAQSAEGVRAHVPGKLNTKTDPKITAPPPPQIELNSNTIPKKKPSIQREFALRLTARPGDPLYNRLSVNAQFFSKITHIMKVGRQNFRPPPQVESSVVRIEPKLGKDRPAVSWAEFDGLLRIVFSRKNKTVRASFGTKEVLALVERNYRTWCALNNVAVDESILVEEGGRAVEEEEEDDDVVDMDMDEGAVAAAVDEDEEEGGMDVDDVDNEDDDLPAFFKEQAAADKANQIAKTPSRRKKTKVAELVRSKIAKVLESTGVADQRAGKLDENAFLKLLYAFNKENIHFA